MNSTIVERNIEGVVLKDARLFCVYNLSSRTDITQIMISTVLYRINPNVLIA